MSAAQCIRDVGNFSVATDPRFKVDNTEFDPVLFLSLLPIVAPKLIALIENIRKKDAADGGAAGLFKHVIYVDNRSALYGARMIAGALTAAGFRSAIMRNTSFDPDAGPGAFAVLSAAEFYGKSMGVTLKKQILDIFNERPGNIHGERIRFMILDSSYREGIDLYDVKYLHIMEPLLSDAELRQVIGRSTRMCGQFGLEFNPDAGWPLYVTRYQLVFTGDLKKHYGVETLFDLYKQHIPTKDKKLAGLLDIMERAVQDAAVDKVLNAPIHEFSLKNARKPEAVAAPTEEIPKERKWQNLFGLIFTPAFLKPAPVPAQVPEELPAAPAQVLEEPAVPAQVPEDVPEPAQVLEEVPEPAQVSEEPAAPAQVPEEMPEPAQVPDLSMGVEYVEPTPEIPVVDIDKIPAEPEPEAEPKLPEINVKILGGGEAMAPSVIMNNAQMNEFITKNYLPAFKWPEPLLENTCTEKKFMKAIKPIDIEELEQVRESQPVLEQVREPRPDSEQTRDFRPDSEQVREPRPDSEQVRKPRPDFNKQREFRPNSEQTREPRPDFNKPREPRPDLIKSREPRPDFNKQREPREPRKSAFETAEITFQKPRENEFETALMTLMEPRKREFESTQAPRPQFNKPRRELRESEFETAEMTLREPREREFDTARPPRQQFNKPRRELREREFDTARPPRQQPRREFETATQRPQVFERSPIEEIDYATFNTGTRVRMGTHTPNNF